MLFVILFDVKEIRSEDSEECYFGLSALQKGNDCEGLY